MQFVNFNTKKKIKIWDNVSGASKVTVIIWFVITVNFSWAQLSLPVDSIYSFIKLNSVHRNSVNWASLEQEFKLRLNKSKTTKDTLNCFVTIFKTLNDPHSSIYFKNNSYGYYRNYSDSEITVMKPLMEKSQAELGKIKISTLKEKYAYIQIPGINAWGDEINRYAKLINDSICIFKNKGIKGFIIDLRLNGGGNLYPMLSGLSSLLGETIIGSERDIDGKLLREWEIKGSNLFQGGYQITSIIPACSVQFSKFPVVILTSSITKSSGSMVAIAFKQRAKTFFIGQPTADGYTTSNDWHKMSDELIVNLASAFVADRMGNLYKNSVKPDLILNGGDNFDDITQDKKILEAINWLGKNPSLE